MAASACASTKEPKAESDEIAEAAVEHFGERVDQAQLHAVLAELDADGTMDALNGLQTPAGVNAGDHRDEAAMELLIANTTIFNHVFFGEPLEVLPDRIRPDRG